MLPNFPKQVPVDNPPVNRTVQVTDEVYRYLLNVSVRESELLQALRRETAQYHMARMAVSPEVGQFLGLLVSLIKPQRLLEVGVFTGYSTVSIAQKMGANATLLAIDKKSMWLEIARKYLEQLPNHQNIETRCANAVDVLVELADTTPSSFDFIFVDADKQNLLRYYELATQLLRPGGLLVVDNTLWWGNVADEGFQDRDTRQVRELNQRLHGDPRFDISLLPIGDGLTLAHFIG